MPYTEEESQESVILTAWFLSIFQKIFPAFQESS